MVVFTPPRGLAKIDPIRRPITSTLKTQLRIDKRLQPNDLMMVELLKMGSPDSKKFDRL